MRLNRRTLGTGAAAFAALVPRMAAHADTRAETRAETLRILSQAGPNTLDPVGIGANRTAIQAHWNLYDRLVRFGTKTQAGGTLSYDYFHIEGELAERFEVADDRCSIIFHLRPGAVFHDGAPVTAVDVKWSLDRVVASVIGRPQFATGSLTSPDQFQVIDASTIRISTPRPDRLTLPNLALTFPIIINAAQARAHATSADPWASDWLRSNVAGGGPYRLDGFMPGESVALSRFDGWMNGERPGFRRILWQVTPAAQTRRALLERGDADLVQDLPPYDAVSLAEAGRVKVVGVPMAGAFQFIGMNTSRPPFDHIKVRQAIASALPYQQMFDAALFRRGRPLFGGAPAADGIAFPQPMGTVTDPVRARALLTEAGYPDGFATTFSFELSLAGVAEPVALLVQEALGRIGIRVTIDKVPAGQLGTLLEKKALPFFFEASSAFLSDPDYFFRIFYHGPTRWNFGSYDNPEFNTLVERTRFETDQAAYDADVARMITLAKTEVPIILLWQPALDTGMLPSIQGYKYEFHRQLDLRTLRRG